MFLLIFVFPHQKINGSLIICITNSKLFLFSFSINLCVPVSIARCFDFWLTVKFPFLLINSLKIVYKIECIHIYCRIFIPLLLMGSWKIVVIDECNFCTYYQHNAIKIGRVEISVNKLVQNC